MNKKGWFPVGALSTFACWLVSLNAPLGWVWGHAAMASCVPLLLAGCWSCCWSCCCEGAALSSSCLRSSSATAFSAHLNTAACNQGCTVSWAVVNFNLTRKVANLTIHQHYKKWSVTSFMRLSVRWKLTQILNEPKIFRKGKLKIIGHIRVHLYQLMDWGVLSALLILAQPAVAEAFYSTSAAPSYFPASHFSMFLLRRMRDPVSLHRLSEYRLSLEADYLRCTYC